MKDNLRSKEVKENKIIDRKPYEEAMMSMMSNASKYVNYSFWSFVIAKMQVSLNRSVPTAGVGFYNNNFQLVINPDFFNPLPLEQRMGILIHECLHVTLKHIFRKGERDHKLFNIACDMALNQSIKRDWLPEGAIYPDTFKDTAGNSWPENKTAEVYYEMLKAEKEKQEKEKQEKQEKCEDQDQDQGESQDQEGQSQGEGESQDQEGQGQGEGESQDQEGQGDYTPSNGNPDLTGSDELTVDDHAAWDSINAEDEELASQMMEKTIKEAIEKSRGNTPANLESILELWKRKPLISWKKVLKKYVSSKVGGKRSTIKRRDRRQPNRIEVKGKRTFLDTPEVIACIDTSGSMSDDEIIGGLVEIHEICKLTKSNLKILQIDTTVKGLEEYDPKKKNFKRNGNGGTYMGAGVDFLMENKIKSDVVIFISDMCIEDVSTDKTWNDWKKTKTPVLWLNTSGTDVSWEGTKGHVIMDINKA